MRALAADLALMDSIRAAATLADEFLGFVPPS